MQCFCLVSCDLVSSFIVGGWVYLSWYYIIIITIDMTSVVNIEVRSLYQTI